MVCSLPASSGFQPALPTAGALGDEGGEPRVVAQEMGVHVHDELALERARRARSPCSGVAASASLTVEQRP